MHKGTIIGGEFGNILIRKKSDKKLEIGELLIAESDEGKMLLQVFDLLYGSQLSQQNVELISGLMLEEDETLKLMDEKVRNYMIARLKNLAFIEKSNAKSAKTLPKFLTSVREVKAEDLSFLTNPKNPLLLGNLRSGSKVLNVPIAIDGKKALSHHVVIAGTTGRGKSVLMTSLLQSVIAGNFASMLVLDPHDEYFEKLKNEERSKEKLIYFSKSPPPGERTLKINVKTLVPNHFNGVIDWSDAQKQAIMAYYLKYKDEWIEAVILGKELRDYHEGTIAVVRRSMMQLLRLESNEANVICKGIFDTHAGETTIKDITSSLELGKTVIIDTSFLQGNVEILIGSIVANEILEHYRKQDSAILKEKPVISIVLEEAPRVLGKEVLERGPNVFATIAREGRKFQVGLVAITQLPSLIPREILANMNTKIILGIELKQERNAMIESAAQDLSSDERAIASLDKGEAIVTSNFLSFATPIKVEMKEAKKENIQKNSFAGVKL